MEGAARPAVTWEKDQKKRMEGRKEGRNKGMKRGREKRKEGELEARREERMERRQEDWNDLGIVNKGRQMKYSSTCHCV